MSIKSKIYKIQGKNYCLKELSLACGVEYMALYRRIVRNNALPRNKRRSIDELSFKWQSRSESFLVVEGRELYYKDYIKNGGTPASWGKLSRQLKKCPEGTLDRLELGSCNTVFINNKYEKFIDVCRANGIHPSTLTSRIEVYPDTPTLELIKNPPNANKGHKLNTRAKKDEKFMCAGKLLTKKQIASKFRVTINTVFRLMRKHPHTPIENLFRKKEEYALNFGLCKTRQIDIKEIT